MKFHSPLDSKEEETEKALASNEFNSEDKITDLSHEVSHNNR